MGVYAHRVTEIKREPQDSISLFGDKKLCERLNVWDSLDADGCGIVWIDFEDIEAAIEDAAKLEIDDETVELLKKDIQAAKAVEEPCLTYYFV